jgi:hypothetical protein
MSAINQHQGILYLSSAHPKDLKPFQIPPSGTYVTLLDKSKFVLLADTLFSHSTRTLWDTGWTSLLSQNAIRDKDLFDF